MKTWNISERGTLLLQFDDVVINLQLTLTQKIQIHKIIERTVKDKKFNPIMIEKSFLKAD